MRPATLRSLLAALFVIALAMPAWPGPAWAQEDEAALLADVLEARATEEPLSGPHAGALVQQAEFATVAAAGVSVTDFIASVAFQNPDDASVPWDFGFDFGRDGDASHRVMVDSTGVWRYSPFPGGATDSGPASSLNREPGGVNTLDLVVNGETGILAVNGEFVISLALPLAVASDVFITTGVYASTTVDAREIRYDDFTVWALPDPNAAPATSTPPPDVIEVEEAPEPESTPEVDANTAPSEEDLATFAFLLEAQAAVAPVAGPYTANLKEESGPVAVSWANVDLADFHATATFSVPDVTSDTPWDIGFMFRLSDEGTLRVALAQDGQWFASVGENVPEATGTLAGLDPAPGAENTLDLLILGDRAVLGVNGSFGASIDLPAGGEAADIAAGVGFFTDHQVEGRVTGFHDFVVRPFDPDALEAAPPPPVSAFSADAEDQFARYVASTAGIGPLAGPLSGELVETGTGTVPLAAAGVSLTNFGAVASFVTPDDLTTLWDGGIQFRTDTTSTNRIVLRSNGEVQVVHGDGTVAIAGRAEAFDAAAGAVNTLQVFVVGDVALVGVNDTLAAEIILAVAPIAGDVQVGTGFFGEDQAAGRVTLYDGFSVWSIA